MQIQVKSTKTILLIGIFSLVIITVLVFLWQQSVVDQKQASLTKQQDLLLETQQKATNLQKQLKTTEAIKEQ